MLVALFESDEWSTMLGQASPGVMQGIIESSGSEHRKIAAQVLEGDAVGSLESMSEHLDTVEQRLVSQLG